MDEYDINYFENDDALLEASTDNDPLDILIALEEEYDAIYGDAL